MSENRRINFGLGVDDEAAEDSLHSYASKLKLKNAIVYLEGLLAENNLIASESSGIIDRESILIGQKLYENTLDLLSENIIIYEDELIHANEACEEMSYEKVEEQLFSDEYLPEEKKTKKRVVEYIPLDYKIKVVNIARTHPTWNLKTLQKNGCHRLNKMRYLSIWREDIIKGGNVFDKYSFVDNWTYDRFFEARQDFQQITTRNLQQWASTAARQFSDFNFKASDRWVNRFKYKHGIRQRKITKLVSRKETISMEETLASADAFRAQILRLIPEYNKNYVINTDQTGVL